MMKKFVLYSIFLITFLGFSQNEPNVSVKVDTTIIRIGEQIKYQISVENADKGVVFPKLQLDSLGKIEVIESFNIDTVKNKLIKKYKLTSFDSGSYTIPKQPIYIWNQPYYTDSIKIDVATVAVDTLKQKMYPIKAIYGEPYTFDDFKSYLWWILGIVAILGIILYFVFRKKETEEEIIAKIPPYQLAVSRLKELDEKQLWQKNKIKQYYIELTDIVRTYIERELNIPALESTTDELLETITDFNTSSSLQIPDDVLKKLQKLLRESDLVKFAKYKPLSNEIELHRNAAGFVIDEIKTVTPEEEDEGQSPEEIINSEVSANQILERQKVVKKKISAKKIIIASVIIMALVGLTILGYYTYKGYKFTKENIIGDSTKELVNKKWIKSTYGYPAVSLETPKFLKPQGSKTPEAYKQIIKQMSVFTYGSLLGDLSISVTTAEFSNLIENYNLETGVDGVLQNVKSSGATITSVNKEPFYIGDMEAIKGKASFSYKNPITKKDTKGVLTVIIVGGKKGSATILVAHKENDKNGKQIAERIINSIEIDDEALE